MTAVPSFRSVAHESEAGPMQHHSSASGATASTTLLSVGLTFFFGELWMKHSKLACLLIAALTLTTACSKRHHDEAADQAIQLVKALPSHAEGLTYGQVLGNSPNCVSRQWDAAKDEYGRDLVTFQCSLTMAQDRLDQLRHETIPMVQNNTRSSGASCPDLAKAYLTVAVQRVNDYFDRFTSGTEVMEFVVNQGEIVETRAGLNDKAGQPLHLNSYGISLVVSDLQATGDGQRGIDHLLAMIRDSAPYLVGGCNEMSQAVPNVPNGSASVLAHPAVAGSAPVSVGDAEPEPKGD